MTATNSVSIELRVIDRATAIFNQIAGSMAKLKTAAKLASVGAAMSGAAVAIGGPLAKAVDDYSEIAGAAAHMATAMDDGAKTQAHINEAMKVAEDLSDRNVVTMKGVADAYYIARSNMLDHAQALAAVRAATDLVIGTTKDAADAQAALEPVTRTLTEVFNNFGDKSKDANKQIAMYADTLAQLQTHYAFKDITEVAYAFQYVVPAAKNAGVAINDAATAVALLSAKGIHGAEAGVAAAELMDKLGKGKLLGYTAFDSHGNIEFGESLMKLKAAFGNLNQEQRRLVLGSIGIEGTSTRAVGLLMDNAKDYVDTINKLNNATGAAATAAKTREAALDEQWIIASNRVHNLMIEIGAQLAPAVLKVLQGFADLLGKVQAFSAAHPTIIKWTIGVAALAAGFLALVGTLAAVGAVLAGLTALATTFDIALLPLLGTVAAVTAGVALIGVAAYEAWKHWDAVKGFFKKWGLDILGFIVAPWAMLPYEIYKHWDKIKAAALSIAHGIAKFFVGHSPIPEGPLHHLDLGGHISKTITPAPILASIRRTAGAVALATPLLMTPMMAGSLAGPSGMGGGSVTINFAPRITVNGGGADIKAEVREAIREMPNEIATLVQREYMRRERLRYR